MKMRKLRFGLAGFFHHNARGDQAVFERVRREIQKLQRQYEFELYIVEYPIYGNEDGNRAVAELNSWKPDFVFLFCASVANGNAVIPFSQLQAGIGVWSIPENAVTGYLPLNSLCGSLVTAGILGTYLKDFHIKFKWFYGYPDSRQFGQRFEVTWKALSAIVYLKESRMGCIGQVVEGFDHLIVNPAMIKYKYGLTIDRACEIDDIVVMAEAFSEDKVKETAAVLLECGKRCEKVSDRDMDRFARLYLALKAYAEENQYDALAVSCWSRLQKLYDVAICAPVAMMNQGGIITSCEADIDGAIGMMIDCAFHQFTPATMVDLVNLDQEKECINLWHCGPAAPCLANEDGVTWNTHFDIGKSEGGNWNGCGVVSDMQYQTGAVTVSRLSTRSNQLIVFEGEMTDEKAYQGSSGWVGKLKMNQEKMEINDLLSTLFKERVDHHLTLGYGHNECAYLEFAYWMDIEVIKKEAYHNYAY